MVRRIRPVEPIVCPFTIAVDGREKAPYSFTGIKADASKNHRPVIVGTEWAHLKTGDYAIVGMEDVAVIERKSLPDLFSTLGQHRERFEREHERMAEIGRAAVVIEASWMDIVHLPPERSQLNPKTVFRTAISWYVRYGVPWFVTEDRRLAEVYTFRFFEKVWREHGKARRNDS